MDQRKSRHFGSLPPGRKGYNPGRIDPMDEDREQELLLHVAAGTDVWTALSALPPDEEKTRRSAPRKPAGCLGVLFVILTLLWALLVML